MFCGSSVLSLWSALKISNCLKILKATSWYKLAYLKEIQPILLDLYALEIENKHVQL